MLYFRYMKEGRNNMIRKIFLLVLLMFILMLGYGQKIYIRSYTLGSIDKSLLISYVNTKLGYELLVDYEEYYEWDSMYYMQDSMVLDVGVMSFSGNQYGENVGMYGDGLGFIRLDESRFRSKELGIWMFIHELTHYLG